MVKFRANAGLNSLRRVTSFTDPTRPAVKCNWSAHADAFAPGPVELWIPGRCLGSPHRARVSMRFRQQTDLIGVDWAPDYRAFSAWVRRS